MKNTISLLSLVCLWPHLGVAASIALDRPVAQSITPTALYYTFDNVTGDAVFDDSEMVGDGELRAGTYELPESVPVVDKRRRGFQNALQIVGGAKTDFYTDRSPFVVVASADHLNLDNVDFTIGVWVKFDDDDSQNIQLISKGISGVTTAKDAGYTLSLERDMDASGNWQISFQIRDGQGANPTRGTGYVLSLDPDIWYHFGVTFEHQTRMAGLWFNGELISELEMPVSVGQGSEILVIGERRTSGYCTEFNGCLDDIFITKGLHEFSPLPSP